MAEPAIDFWFSIGSTYTYLSIMRVVEAQADSGVAVRWRPFSVCEIMREMNNRFLQGKPEKYSYMWRDISRRADMLGIVAKVPVPHPLSEFDRPNRVAVLGTREGWCVAFVQAAFRHWFEQGAEPGLEPALSASIRAAGQDPERVLPLVDGEEIGRAYDGVTAEARALGIFGSPTFAVGPELFWGDDRLEHALSWARHGRLVASELVPRPL